ncbi:Phosphatases II [Mycena indigotica]|uniref:Phosphatases II n=1 Tax=Mycena indigotica TaxID=2126181 RepID=A0A8H6WHE9_9AGAR|nr:Phosphatases II [Mycena indigotica]KAF7315003.1 Phosphatases II [Mycena indigotica]
MEIKLWCCTAKLSPTPPLAMASPSVDEIISSQIFLANLAAAQSCSTRERFGITHIVSVCLDYPSTGPNHLVIPVNDCEYDDLLIHLPETCSFIEEALSQGGRVLIHCLMGVSRSTTVLAAYFMKTRLLSASAAISFIRKRRPCVQPNYGFLKQLDAFQACGYAPATTHPAYRLWKRKHKQDAAQFLNYFLDTAAILPKKLFLNSDFPSDSLQAELLLYELEVTHLLTIGPAQVAAPLPTSITHQNIDIPPDSSDHSFCLPSASAFIRDALGSGGRVLVHSLLEARACVAVGGYLMTERQISVEDAAKVIQDALPLFSPSLHFTRALTSFQSSSVPKSPSSSNDADFMVQAATSLMSESGIDLRAFSDVLVAIQLQKPSVKRAKLAQAPTSPIATAAT